MLSVYLVAVTANVVIGCAMFEERHSSAKRKNVVIIFRKICPSSFGFGPTNKAHNRSLLVSLLLFVLVRRNIKPH